MLLHHARRTSRTGPGGRLVPLSEQDRSRWDTGIIAEGVTILQAALARDRLGEYQAQAAIAALHADARTTAETDWVQIVEWYDELLAAAIIAVETAAPADYYGVNCAHPAHLLAGLDGGVWQQRLTFFRPNASILSHAELDAMEELDTGDMPLLVSATQKLRAALPAIAVLGGCCGTDSRHVAALWSVNSSR
jgi:hypothetical protein